MGLSELFFIALGLSADAFAVAVTNGLCSEKNSRLRIALLSGAVFGLFQGIMPTLGFALGNNFTSYITSYDHIIALVLLSFIGGRMVISAITEKNPSPQITPSQLSFKALLVQGFATSIDALAVGVGFSAMQINIVFSALFIASVTFFIALGGVNIL